jgi:glutamate-1-semialdehyde 2,1-aminomutase
MSLGQWPEDAQNLSVLPWNNLEAVAAELHRLDGQVAAVITEPVMYNGLVSGVKPKDDFLRGLRTLCDENGCLLIFDEIITGFRLSLGGAQEFFSVTPDIVTLAKALGGGAPISAVAGRRDLMSLFGSGTVVHTGTYNGHPAAVAGALMTLRALSRNNGHLISVISDSGNALKSGIEALGSRSRLPLQVRGFGPAFTVVFRNSRDEPIDARSALNGLDHDLMRRWHTTLQAWGVRTSPEGLWYISSAHTSTDVALTIERVQKSLRDLEDAYH